MKIKTPKYWDYFPERLAAQGPNGVESTKDIKPGRVIGGLAQEVVSYTSREVSWVLHVSALYQHLREATRPNCQVLRIGDTYWLVSMDSIRMGDLFTVKEKPT